MPKSIFVIKDLDRFLMEKKSTGISLSGVLNFMDGILNLCCAEERIMVFTMTSSDLTRRSREVVLPANVGPTIMWTSPVARGADWEISLVRMKEIDLLEEAIDE
ncbi:hypothetical protein K1719_017940 [Acacia pycnantha]|nr:hypothetical protein K1719_017940 [Acacia pycnantha]